MVYGGTPIAQNKKILKGSCPHVLIDTSGRVPALCRGKDLKLEKFQQFMLDDYDKCLDKLDMRKDMQKIFVKQLMMFSATMTARTKALCKTFLQELYQSLLELCRKGRSL